MVWDRHNNIFFLFFSPHTAVFFFVFAVSYTLFQEAEDVIFCFN